MTRFRTLIPRLVAVAALAATLGVPGRANAGFTMTLTEMAGASVVDTVTISDRYVGPGGSSDLNDVDARKGVINYSGGVGDFDIQGNFGTSNAPGTPAIAKLTVNNLSITATGFTGARTLIVTIQDDGFSQPLGPNGLNSQLSTTQLPTGTNVTYQSFVNSFAGSLLSLNTIGGTVANDFVNVTGPTFTLKSVTTINFNGAVAGDTFQSSGITAVTPAPSALLLLASGIPLLGAGLRLRLRRDQVETTT